MKALRKENDGLKKQLQQLTKDFESMKAKMVEGNEAMVASLPNQDDVQFLSDSYDNLVQSKDDIAQELLNLHERPAIDKPTRVCQTSATLIDNIFLNNPDQVLSCGNIISDISDHFSQFCIFRSMKEKIKIKKKVKL